MASILDKLTYDHLVEWTSTTYDDGRDPTCCANGAQYLRTFFDKMDIDEPDAYPHSLTTSKEILDWKGWYHVYQEGHEIHYFSLLVEGETLTIFHTYGGIERFMVAAYKTSDWTAWYELALKGSKEAYDICFGITSTSTDGVGLKITYAGPT